MISTVVFGTGEPVKEANTIRVKHKYMGTNIFFTDTDFGFLNGLCRKNIIHNHKIQVIKYCFVIFCEEVRKQMIPAYEGIY